MLQLLSLSDDLLMLIMNRLTPMPRCTKFVLSGELSHPVLRVLTDGDGAFGLSLTCVRLRNVYTKCFVRFAVVCCAETRIDLLTVMGRVHNCCRSVQKVARHG